MKPEAGMARNAFTCSSCSMIRTTREKKLLNEKRGKVKNCKEKLFPLAAILCHWTQKFLIPSKKKSFDVRKKRKKYFRWKLPQIAWKAHESVTMTNGSEGAKSPKILVLVLKIKENLFLFKKFFSFVSYKLSSSLKIHQVISGRRRGWNIKRWKYGN